MKRTTVKPDALVAAIHARTAPLGDRLQSQLATMLTAHVDGILARFDESIAAALSAAVGQLAPGGG